MNELIKFFVIVLVDLVIAAVAMLIWNLAVVALAPVPLPHVGFWFTFFVTRIMPRYFTPIRDGKKPE